MSKHIRKLLPSGNQLLINNRIGWARTYLKKAGLLEYPERGVYRITERGINVISESPSEITNDYLTRFPEFIEFTQTKRKKTEPQTEIIESLDPIEMLENSYQKINKELADELLNQIKQASPKFFEKIVVDLLVKMGYGGSRKDAGEAIGQSGDEGIDGIIKEDARAHRCDTCCHPIN